MYNYMLYFILSPAYVHGYLNKFEYVAIYVDKFCLCYAQWLLLYIKIELM